MIFSSIAIKDITKDLVNVLNFTNKYGYSCGQGEDQVYGCAYKALKNLLIKEFGAKATEIAMNSSTWCVSDFEGQIVPAIEYGINQAKIMAEAEKANKMISFLCENGINAYHYDDNTIIIYEGKDEDISVIVNVDWNDVHEYLESKGL